VKAPDQGLHLIAEMPVGLDEATVQAVGEAAGLSARRLSLMYLKTPRRQGLVMGFSGFAPEAFNQAARRLCEGLQAL